MLTLVMLLSLVDPIIRIVSIIPFIRYPVFLVVPFVFLCIIPYIVFLSTCVLLIILLSDTFFDIVHSVTLLAVAWCCLVLLSVVAVFLVALYVVLLIVVMISILVHNLHNIWMIIARYPLSRGVHPPL